jgi:glycine dehydrogenase subunit 2
MSVREHFHQAAWQQPLITEQGSPGHRGQAVPTFDGPEAQPLPDALRRSTPPELPELGQPQVLRHYMRLSQMTLAHNVAIDATIGTTTPKYPPVVNEQLARWREISELHPDQPAGTVQGLLRLLWELGQCLKALSGMDAVALQPQGGAHAILSNVLIIRAYHEARGDDGRDEMISTLATHPTNPAAASAAGFKIIELPPGPKGYAELDALKAAVSDRTAGLFINNPEDTGVFNPDVDRLAEIVHEAGGLCAYDQANANATLGLARARESGFDLCHFNLHKTFGAPMHLYGPAAGAVCVTSELDRFLPTPVVVKRDDAFLLDRDRPDSIGPIRAYAGNIAALIKAYAWIRSLGPEWISEVSHIAVLNNNYVQHRLEALRGFSLSFPDNAERRMDVVRYSLEEFKDATGFGAEDLNDRLVDYGIEPHWTSHHPYTSPEPLTIEPTESFSKDELDELADVYERVVEEAHDDPETVAAAPHRGALGKMKFEEPEPGEIPLATARLLRQQTSDVSSATTDGR